MSRRPPRVIVGGVTGNAEPAPSDPAEQILALQELRDLGLLDEDEVAEAAAASLGERPDPASRRASLGQGNRTEG